MHTYTATYSHSETDSTGKLRLDATTDAEAIKEVRAFVSSGYRNGTWASTALQDGRTYTAHNQHGSAVGGFA